jgi:hypothetical protein
MRRDCMEFTLAISRFCRIKRRLTKREMWCLEVGQWRVKRQKKSTVHGATYGLQWTLLELGVR